MSRTGLSDHDKGQSLQASNLIRLMHSDERKVLIGSNLIISARIDTYQLEVLISSGIGSARVNAYEDRLLIYARGHQATSFIPQEALLNPLVVQARLVPGSAS